MPQDPEDYDDYENYDEAEGGYEEALNEIKDSGGDGGDQQQDGGELASRKGSGTSQRSSASAGSAQVVEEAKITFAGLEVVFWDEVIDDKFLCVVCNQVLRYPVQFEECGHRCCSSCLSDLLRVSPRCPLCPNASVSRDKVYVDTAFGNEIGKIAICCPFHKKGCQWEGQLSDNKEHQDNCNFVEVECPNSCGAQFDKRFLKQHLSDDCTKRMVTCEFCKETVFYKDEIAHMNSCKEFPVPCPNGCKLTEIPRGEVKAHVENDCPKAKIPCPFSDMGCEYKCERQKMQKHTQDEPVEHLGHVCGYITKQRQLINKHHETLINNKDALAKCVQKVQDLEKLYGSQLVWKIDKYAERMQEAKTGKKITIFSPPFMTSRHGYKLAVSLCLNGDGKAKSHFMSVFVCICKGEYDALLPWPFCHRCTFTLIDQCQDPAARRNISYTIKPNVCKENKPFLGRPLGERNASFGTQKFIPLNTMKTLDYIRDDTMFIKVHIDYDNMILL